MASRRKPASRSTRTTSRPSARRESSALRVQLARALERERATAAVLRVIASSPATAEPVFDEILDNALRLCASPVGLLFLFDGDTFRLVAHRGAPDAFVAPRMTGFRPGPHTGLARAVTERRVVQILDMLADQAYLEGDPTRLETIEHLGARSGMWAPLLKEGMPIGALCMWRREVQAFTPAQLELLSTFADQAVIAMENVRLFREVQASNRELTEALEQQTATGEILRVISGSPTDVQPVFDAIAQSAVRLCDALFGVVFRFDGTLIHMVAHHNFTPEGLAVFQAIFPCPPSEASLTTRAILHRMPVQVADVQSDRDVPPDTRWGARGLGFRTGASVPMLREGRPIGAISVARREARPFSDKDIALLQTFAAQAVIAIENVRLFQELQARNRELTEALEQQTATGEILRVISSSPTDAHPVFDAIAESAVRLCDGRFCVVTRFDGECLHLVAHHNLTPAGLNALRPVFPMALGRQHTSGRAILDRAVVHVPDLLEDPEYPRDVALAGGWRCMLAVPMLRDGRPIGTIQVARSQPVPFSDKQIKLMKTFADQAVIAIENVRLFQEVQARNRELTEALEQQTATADILRVISSSPTDIQPVLDAVAESAARLCDSLDGSIFLVNENVLRLVAHHGPIPEAGVVTPRDAPLVRGTVGGRAVIERRMVQVVDLQAEAEEFPEGSVRARQIGWRTQLSVPLLREGAAIGVISVRRVEARPFSDRQAELLQTFAAQAVIALENVRLFQELQARNRDLTEALEQQTTTSEILRVISGSPTEIQPVFDAVVASAARLCEATDASLYRIEGDAMRHVASHGMVTSLELGETRPITRGSASGRAILSGETVHLHDIQAEGRKEFPDVWHAVERQGIRTVLGVPLLREERPIGAIVVRRTEIRPFAMKQIELLKTFAAQAVIAIENVRLFQELQARNRELTEALEQQTATSEVLGVISSSPSDLQPVYDTILANVTRLCDARIAALFLYDGEVLVATAHSNASPEFAEFLRGTPRRPGHETTTRLAALERRVVHVHDLLEDPAFDPPEVHRAENVRTVLSVPMLREGALVGVITTWRREVRPFTDTQIALVKTFADQAVIAIENVRLFQEVQARNRELTEALEQQTATADILRVISSSPTDIQPVLDAVAENATRLCEARDVSIALVQGDVLKVVASYGSMARWWPDEGIPINRESVTGRAFVDRQPVHIHDLAVVSDEEFPQGKIYQRRGGHRTNVAIPLLREGVPVGVIAIRRVEVKPFTEKQIALLQTFADQAVIAIENVRLFQELQARNRELTEALEQQTATAGILQVMSGSPTDVQPVFDAIVRSAVRLCNGLFGVVFRFDGELVHFAAEHGFSAEARDVVSRAYPLAPTPDNPSSRAILDRTVVNVADILAEPRYRPVTQQVLGYRSVLAVPMLREGIPIGVIVVTRTEVKPFSDKEVGLLRTFADQAVIAIENVRLFQELQARNGELTEALEQQTATAEILRVISRSQTDPKPVFDAIVQSAMRLCSAPFGGVLLVDNGRLVPVFTPQTPEHGEFLRLNYPRPVDDTSLIGRAIVERRMVHVPDVEDPGAPPRTTRGTPFRSQLTVPMLRGEQVVGAIVVARPEPGPFSDTQIALLETFADQAVIAIENVRLFQELRARTQELARTVGELRALGEVGQAVSSTLDLETVLNTVVARADELSGTDGGGIYEYDEVTERFRLRATQRLEPELVEILRTEPIRLGEGVVGRAGAERRPIQVPDILAEGAYHGRLRAVIEQAGYRAILAVPLLREDRLVGGLVMRRRVPGEFPPETVHLLQTFAAQSVLAIENARLFREIEDKSRQLEVADRHKSEFLANMSHELRTPLNAIIGFSEVLLQRMFGEVNPKQTEYLEDILSSGRHLLSLINDILDLSKVEAGRMELELAPFDLPLALDNALTLVRERATRQGLTLERAVDARLGEVVADERKVKQIVLNLLSNALKFTPPGGRVRLEARPADGVVEIAVTDTGIGIAPEHHAAIFEEFRQVGGDYARKREGTGLGLTLTRKFVELHGGKIRVESELGHGATFTFTLPVRPWPAS